jgi:hypothetical protein
MRDRNIFPILVGLGLLTAALWPTTASIPALPAIVPAAPTADRAAMLDELAFWMRGSQREFGLFGERPLSAVEGRQHAFALFDDASRPVERRELLTTLPYGALIEDAAQRYRLDSLLLAAVVQTESGFDARAISPQGAQGLMQLMPLTARSYGAHAPGDPRANVRAGARYLRDLLAAFDDDLELALAAYNAGPAAVRRFHGVPPYRETRNYVERVLTLYLGYHRTLWREAQLDQLLGDLPQPALESSQELMQALLAPSIVAPRARRSGGAGRTVLAGALAVVPATQALTEVADPLAETLAELRQPRVAEDQQHDGEDDQQLRDTKASEHVDLRGLATGGGVTAARVTGFTLADPLAPPPTPAAAPAPALAAPARQETIATPAPEWVPPA